MCETIKRSVTNIKTKYFNKIKTMHMYNMNTRKQQSELIFASVFLY